jgi:predicted nucleotidyltransferase
MKKLTRNQGIKILNEYINTELPKLDWYPNVKHHIKGIVFYGSTAKEQNRPDSDLDFLIFVPAKIETQYTTGEYFYKFEKYDNREINICFRSLERLRKLGRERKDKVQAEVFRMSEVLWEKDGEVRDLIKKIQTLR